MGISISGWIEVESTPDQWRGIVTIDPLLTQNTAGFDSLFGAAGGRGPFRPLAAGRGFPPDASTNLVDRGWSSSIEHPSWISWAELLAADWNETTPDSGPAIRRYRHGATGTSIPAPLVRREPRPETDEDDAAMQAVDLSALPLGHEWKQGEWVYRVESLRRRETLNVDWDTILEIMVTLARRFGNEGVRLVVWFSR